MVNTEYSIAATEVLEILDNTNKEDIEKIPKKFIDFLKQNCSKNYKPNIDYSRPIEEMNLKKKTIDILAIICSKYWCDDFNKIEFDNMLEWNEIIQKEKLNEKYNSNNIFNNTKTTNLEQSLIVKENNQNFITNIKNFFIKLFKH